MPSNNKINANLYNRMSTFFIVFWGLSLLTFNSYAVSKTAIKKQSKQSFANYVVQIKAKAITLHKFSPALITKAFAKIHYYKRAIKADHSQPEKIETLDTYLPKRITAWKVSRARFLFKKYKKTLTRIGDKYGVQPRFIVALWGLETNFGKYTGNYNVISALTTLAYEGRREAFFKKQLWAALTILAQGNITPDKMIGSWAGAMGQSQFMPTSYLAHAVDGDGDGKIDIWNNTTDVFASIANYLKQEGWNDELTWGRQVKLPLNFDTSLAIPKKTGNRKKWLAAWNKHEKTLITWQALGVRRIDGTSLPQVNIKAVLIFPDGKNGRAYLAYNNYKSLMHWNLSYYFVSSVGHLSDHIKFPPIK